MSLVVGQASRLSAVVGRASRLSPWLKPSQQKDAEAPWSGLGTPRAPRLKPWPNTTKAKDAEAPSVRRQRVSAIWAFGIWGLFALPAAGRDLRFGDSCFDLLVAFRPLPAYNRAHDIAGRGTSFPVPGGRRRFRHAQATDRRLS